MRTFFFVRLNYLSGIAFMVVFLGGQACAAEPSSQAVEIVAAGNRYPSLKDYKKSEILEKKVMERLRALDSVEPAMGLIPDRASQEDQVAVTSSDHPLNTELDANGWKTLRVAPQVVQDKAFVVAATDTAQGLKNDVPSLSDSTDNRKVVAGVTPAVSEVVKEFQVQPSTTLEQAEKVQTVQELSQKLKSQVEKADGPLLLMSDQGRVKLMDLETVVNGQRFQENTTEDTKPEKRGVPGP